MAEFHEMLRFFLEFIDKIDKKQLKYLYIEKNYGWKPHFLFFFCFSEILFAKNSIFVKCFTQFFAYSPLMYAMFFYNFIFFIYYPHLGHPVYLLVRYWLLFKYLIVFKKIQI